MTDYEQIQAREWKLALPTVGADQPPDLAIDNPDIEATVVWRQRGRAQTEITLPKRLAPIEQNRVKSQVKPRSLFDAFPRLRVIALETKTHIHQVNHYRNRILTLGIWGSSSAADAAKHQIKAWIDEIIPKEERETRWAKVYSTNEEEKTLLEKELELDAERQQFRKEPPEDVEFAASAACQWPVTQYRAVFILGKSYEALDPIRMDHSCYITHQDRNSTFMVLGASWENVLDAVKRVRGTFFQIQARLVEAPVRYIFRPLSENEMKSNVGLLVHEQSRSRKTNRENGAPAEMYPELVRGDHLVDIEGSSDKKSTFKTKEIKRAIQRALKSVSYFRGNLSFKVRYGTFILTSYKPKEVQSVPEFLSMMQDPQASGYVTNDIGQPNLVATLRNRFVAAKRLLEPIDHFTDALVKVQPLYSGTIVLKQNEHDALLRLHVEYQINRNGEVDCIEKKWSRVGAESGQLLQRLNANVIDLAKPCAWCFELSGGHQVDASKQPSLLKFANGIRLDKDIARQSQEYEAGQFIKFNLVHGLEVRSLQQSLVYRYRITGTPYQCELSKIVDFVAPKTLSSLRNPCGLEPENPQWAVSVYNPEWPFRLEENTHLEIGKETRLTSNLATYFPRPDHKFFKEFDRFLSCLVVVEGIMHGNSM